MKKSTQLIGLATIWVDKLASLAVEANQVSYRAVVEHDSAMANATLVLRRIAAAHQMVVDSLGPIKQKFKRVSTSGALVRAIVASQHSLIGGKRDTRFLCIRCRCSVPRKALKAWLKKGHCQPKVARATTNLDLGQPAEGARVIVGHTQLHASHRLALWRNFWFCTRCGFYTTAAATGQKSSTKLLARPCAPPTRAGKGYLSRFARNLPPRNGI